jgi:hypothetical protein
MNRNRPRPIQCAGLVAIGFDGGLPRSRSFVSLRPSRVELDQNILPAVRLYVTKEWAMYRHILIPTDGSEIMT